MKIFSAIGALVLGLLATVASAADYPAPKQGEWIARDFKFHTGEAMPELRLHYTTIGESTGMPVVVLHGSGGSAANMLTPAFAGELFGAGQPLDATKYYIILPDALGHGKSSKPSDGLKTKFPRYDYADMVDAQYRLLSEGLGIRHVRLVIGNSMGGMNTWLWGEKYPGYMDALVPMASQPTAMASRNWMLRRMMLETIRNDPDYNNGELHHPAALHEDCQRVLRHRHRPAARSIIRSRRRRASRPTSWWMPASPRPMTADANDFLWQWGSSADLRRGARPREDPGVGARRSTPPMTSAIRRKPA